MKADCSGTVIGRLCFSIDTQAMKLNENEDC